MSQGQGQDQRENQHATRCCIGKQKLLLAISTSPYGEERRRNPSFCNSGLEQILRRPVNLGLRVRRCYFRSEKFPGGWKFLGSLRQFQMR